MTTATIKPKNKIKRDRVFPIVNTLILILLCFITLYPVLNTVAYSFNRHRPLAPGVESGLL